RVHAHRSDRRGHTERVHAAAAVLLLLTRTTDSPPLCLWQEAGTYPSKSRHAQLAGNAALTAGYIGSHGTNLPRSIEDVNQVPLSLVATSSDGQNWSLTREQMRTQFRIEAFNLFNTPNFQAPKTKIFDGSGRVIATGSQLTSPTQTSERQIQLALKLSS